MIVALLATLKAGGVYVPLDRSTRPTGWLSCCKIPAPGS